LEEIMAQTVPERTEETGLGKGLKRRHMNLIALGGVIGAGLFVGSGVVIGGPVPPRSSPSSSQESSRC
jgi:GABA permease